MLVLVDIEWVDDYSGRQLTQLSALRVDENWDVVDRFSSLVCPQDLKTTDWGNLAFNGYNPNEFCEAGDETACIRSFIHWLQEDDVPCTWHYITQTELKRFIKRVFPEGTGHRVRHACNKVEDILLSRYEKYKRLYALAETYGADLLAPEHCADNDVLMFREVMLRIGVPQELFLKTDHIGLFEEEEADVPSPEPFNADTLPLTINFFDGSRVYTTQKNVVGYCRYKLHPGPVSKQLLLRHDCLGKQCPFLKKNEKSSYWVHLEQEQIAKERAKQKQLKAREEKRDQAERLIRLTEKFRAYLDQTDYNMEIIRLEQVQSWEYKIYYVSAYPFADGNRFPDFLALLKENHPGWCIILRHIKDEQGRFVTINEYHARRKR